MTIVLHASCRRFPADRIHPFQSRGLAGPGNVRAPLSQRAHEGVRLRRLVRQRQDHADRAPVPRFTAPGLRVAGQARAPQLRRRPAGQGPYPHREAGCKEVMVSSRSAGSSSTSCAATEPALEQQIERMSPCDLLLVEGYKRYPMPKLEVYRRRTASRSSTRRTRISSRSPPTWPLATKLPALRARRVRRYRSILFLRGAS